MAGELKLKQTETLRLEDSLLLFEYWEASATVNEYKLTDELIQKLDSEEIYIEDIDLLETELELVDTTTITQDIDALEKLKEMYFPIELFSEEDNSFDRINNLKDIISHKEAEYSLSMLNLVKGIISEILSIQGKDTIFIKEENLKDTSFITDSRVKPIKVDKQKITFLHTYLGKFDIPLENLGLQSLIELSNII